MADGFEGRGDLESSPPGKMGHPGLYEGEFEQPRNFRIKDKTEFMFSRIGEEQTTLLLIMVIYIDGCRRNWYHQVMPAAGHLGESTRNNSETVAPALIIRGR